MSPGDSDAPALNDSQAAKFSLLGLFVTLWVVSCLYPPYPNELVLQHIPTVIAVLLLVAVEFILPLSLGSYIAVLAFLCLHRWARGIYIQTSLTTNGSTCCEGVTLNRSAHGTAITMTEWFTSVTGCC